MQWIRADHVETARILQLRNSTAQEFATLTARVVRTLVDISELQWTMSKLWWLGHRHHSRFLRSTTRGRMTRSVFKEIAFRATTKNTHWLQRQAKELPIRLAPFLQYQHAKTAPQRKQDIHSLSDDCPSNDTASDSQAKKKIAQNCSRYTRYKSCTEAISKRHATIFHKPCTDKHLATNLTVQLFAFW